MSFNSKDLVLFISKIYRVLGQEVFIEMHLVVAPREISSAYKIVEKVKQRLRQKYGSVNTIIQLEPYENIELLESHLEQPQS